MATQIKDLVAQPGFVKELDQELVQFFLGFTYVPGEETLFKGVYKLEPGGFLTYDATAGLQLGCFWELTFEPDESKSLDDWADAIEGAIEASLGEVCQGVRGRSTFDTCRRHGALFLIDRPLNDPPTNPGEPLDLTDGKAVALELGERFIARAPIELLQFGERFRSESIGRLRLGHLVGKHDALRRLLRLPRTLGPVSVESLEFALRAEYVQDILRPRDPVSGILGEFPVTAPCVFLEASGACLEWVEVDVSHDRHELAVAKDRLAAEPSLKKMADVAVLPVEKAGVAPEQLAHRA